MELGIFMMPLHPARSVTETYKEDLRKIILGDKLGYSEVWIGQHFTASTEPIASPLMFMAQALAKTENITFATGVLNLPCFNPAVVAAEVAQFDHMSEGRFIFGIGSGALASDFELFGNADGAVRMGKTVESIRMIRDIWASDPPYHFEGDYWTIKVTDNINPELGMGWMLKPYQQPHPPIAISVMSPFSGTAKFAGSQGWIPISANFIPRYSVASHWKKYLEGAEGAGVKADPGKWRVCRNIVVAETDAEAEEMVFGPESNLLYYYDYLWKALKAGDYTIALKPDPKMSDDDVTVDLLMKEMVIYGSPETVARKLAALRDMVGPFGKLMLAMPDWQKNPEKEERSMRLLAEKVLPRFRETVEGSKVA